MVEVPSRYSQQTQFHPIGIAHQKRLMQCSVVVIGCGALGSVSACYLVRAGIGHLRIVDRDFIEESNLQRQILFDEDDISNNLPKAVVAQNKLKRVNSHVTVEGIVADVNHTNIEELISGADIILDGTDNFETRFLINDVCVKNTIPWIYGACIGSRGLTMNIMPSQTPCLRCVFENLPQAGSFPTCNTAGVIGPIAGMIASIQVTEALKILIKDFESTSKRLCDIDVWKSKFKQLDVQDLRKLNDCPACKSHNYEFLNAKEGTLTTLLCGRNAIQVTYRNVGETNIQKLAERLRPTIEVSCNEFMLRFRVDGIGFTLFPDGRAIITGTDDKDMAKGLYAKYLGM